MSVDLSVPPQPAPDPDTEGFWRATAEGRLAMCRCLACRTWMQPPLERCRRCGSETAFEDVSGDGEVHSYIVVRHPVAPGYLDNLPYVVALVELDEQPGLRLSARLLDTPPDEVRIGMRVRTEIVPHPGGDHHIPVFRAA